MARIGLKHPIAAKITGESPIAYGEAKKLAELMSANININNSGVEPLYGDDEIVETDNGFSDGTVEIGTTDLSDENYAFIGGHALTTDANGDTEVLSFIGDIAPYLGLGFYMVRRRKGVPSYQARIFPKVQFAEPGEESQTKGTEISWQTPTLTATILTIAGVPWVRRKTFKTEAAARDYVESMLGYGGEPDKTALNAKIAEVTAMNPEEFTSVSWGVVAIAMAKAQAISVNTDAGNALIGAALNELTEAVAALVPAA